MSKAITRVGLVMRLKATSFEHYKEMEEKAVRGNVKRTEVKRPGHPGNVKITWGLDLIQSDEIVRYFQEKQESSR